MLVLSRRPNEAICFPALGVSVSVVSVQGSRVRIGVEAPSQVQVVRSELLDEASDEPSALATRQASEKSKLSSAANQPTSSTRQCSHDFKNRLNSAVLGLHLAQKYLATGQHEQAAKLLQSSVERLHDLEKEAETRTEGHCTPQFSTSSNVAEVREQRPEPKSSVDILLIEDDQNERSLLKTLLEYEGYSVCTATDGIDAMQRLDTIKPKFVLLDMMMPRMNGKETCDAIRSKQNLESIPIFAVSGSSPDTMGLSIGAGGLDQWFPKPLDTRQLFTSLRERCEPSETVSV